MKQKLLKTQTCKVARVVKPALSVVSDHTKRGTIHHGRGGGARRAGGRWARRPGRGRLAPIRYLYLIVAGWIR